MKTLSTILILGTTLLLFSSCYNKIDPKTKAGLDAIFSYSEELKKTKGLELSRYGGCFNDGIKKLSIGYQSTARLDLRQTRKLFIETLEFLLIQINKDPSLKEYLNPYPFKPENLDVSISFPWDLLSQ